MLRSLVRGLLSRLLGYGGLLLGFWWLREAFIEVNYPVGVLGGLTILAAMYMVVGGRHRPDSAIQAEQSELSETELSKSEEDNPGDSLDGRDESNQLPP